MGSFSLRRFDVQARVSLVLALASVITFIGLVLVVLRRFDPKELVVYYGGPTKTAIYLGTAVTLLLAAIGSGMGLNSVGQRRNDKQTWSWIGFFVGAVIICLTLVVFFFFRQRGETAVP